jgi:hypothetical protein
MRWTVWIAAACALVLAACGRAPLETEADQTARSFFTALSRADWPGVDATLAPSALAAANRHLQFEGARRAIPGGAPTEAKGVGWGRTETAGRKRLTALHLYRYPGADLVVTTSLERIPPSNGYRVVGLVLNRLPPDALEANRFTLDKPARQLVFLASAVASPLIMIGVALLVIVTPGLKLKPLWFLLCFLGVGVAYMNWTTGQGGFAPTQLAVINLGFTRATDISPWIVRFSAPVGAILVGLGLMAWRARKTAA